MYCRNCGNEILETDKYCEKCGNKLIHNNWQEYLEKNFPARGTRTNLQEIKQNEFQKTTNTVGNNSKKLPMNWWNFWKYVRFPLGLVASFFRLSTYQYSSIDFYVLAFVVMEIAVLIFTIHVYDLFRNNKKDGYQALILYLFVESIFSCGYATLNNALNNTTVLSTSEVVLTYLFVLVIWSLIWILPNYIYFKKRKSCFCND